MEILGDWNLVFGGYSFGQLWLLLRVSILFRKENQERSLYS